MAAGVPSSLSDSVTPRTLSKSLKRCTSPGSRGWDQRGRDAGPERLRPGARGTPGGAARSSRRLREGRGRGRLWADAGQERSDRYKKKKITIRVIWWWSHHP